MPFVPRFLVDEISRDAFTPVKKDEIDSSDSMAMRLFSGTHCNALFFLTLLRYFNVLS